MGKVIGYTTGVFDLFHVGHLNILSKARAECDYLIVGVTTDELAKERKGALPVVPLFERMEIVQNVRFVDNVVPQVTMDKLEAWRNLKFDVMFVGDDWKGSSSWTKLEEDFAQLSVKIVYFPYTQHTSSRILRNQLFGE